MKFQTAVNQVYYIAVDGRDGFAGNVVLNIRQTPNWTSPNDFLAGAIRIAATEFANDHELWRNERIRRADARWEPWRIIVVVALRRV